MHFITSRINQRHEQRLLPQGTGHDAYRDRPPPEPWEPGWTPPPIPAAVEAERLLAWAIVHHWKPIEEKPDDSH